MTGQGTRRELLTLLGSGTAVALAGCGGDDSTPTEPEPESGDHTETPTPEPEYSLEVSLTYDLSDLDIDEPQNHDEEYVEEHFSQQVEVTLLENGTEVNREQLTDLHLENEDGETIDPEEQIPEYGVKEGETIYVTAQTENGETLETETTVEKRLPGEYVMEVLVDGSKQPWHDWIQNIRGTQPEEYTTPYEFDTHYFKFDEFYEARKPLVEEIAEYDTIGATDAISTARATDFEDLSKQEKIAEASRITNDEMPGASAAAQSKAQTMEYILREHTGINEPIAAGGFNNPAQEDSNQSNHGSQMIHADGDNYHSETFNYPGNNATPMDSLEDLNMLSETAAQGDYVSVVGELSRDFEQVSGRQGRPSLHVMLDAFAHNNMFEKDANLEAETAFTVRDKIVENQFEEALLATMIGAHHGRTKDRHTISLDTENTILLISSTIDEWDVQAEEKLLN